jgi:hypothetical protein
LLAALVEAFGAGEHDLANPVERVSLAAALTQGLVLDPAPHRVQAPVADAYDVEWVGHTGGVILPAREPGPVGLGHISGHHRGAREPVSRLRIEPSAQVGGTVALDQVDEDALIEIDRAGGMDRRTSVSVELLTIRCSRVKLRMCRSRHGWCGSLGRDRPVRSKTGNRR